MKKWIFGTIIIVLIFAGFFYWKSFSPKPSDRVLSAIQAPTAVPILPQSTIMEADGISIRVSWSIVQPENVELYSNLKEQKLFEEIRVNKSCKTLVNGGFYSTENIHLGLFIADFEIISEPIRNSLFNGFIWVNLENKVLIGADLPDENIRWGLQTGPLLVLNGQPVILAIKNDEPSRRIVAGITRENKLIFMAFYRVSSEFEGPLLEKLPEIIEQFEKQTNIEIVDAINLDGGKHSIFISNYDLLRELEFVGSYFCTTR